MVKGNYEAVVKVRHGLRGTEALATEAQRHGENLMILCVSVSLWRISPCLAARGTISATGCYGLRPPAMSSATPPATAAMPMIGGSGIVFSRSAVA